MYTNVPVAVLSLCVLKMFIIGMRILVTKFNFLQIRMSIVSDGQIPVEKFTQK